MMRKRRTKDSLVYIWIQKKSFLITPLDFETMNNFIREKLVCNPGFCFHACNGQENKMTCVIFCLEYYGHFDRNSC
jgi:hypothetical protein